MRLLLLPILLLTALGSLAPPERSKLLTSPPATPQPRHRIVVWEYEPAPATHRQKPRKLCTGLCTATAHEWLWRTVYGEARGQGATEIKAIARIIRNRLANGRWGRTLKRVVLARRQFSAWNADDPNFPIISDDSVRHRRGFARVRRLCEQAWREAAAGAPDPTRGALHYHHGRRRPYWAKGHRALKIGAMYTYRLRHF